MGRKMLDKETILKHAERAGIDPVEFFYRLYKVQAIRRDALRAKLDLLLAARKG